MVCPIQKSFGQGVIGEKAYVAYAQNEKIRLNGSSGGVFETLADWVISQQGSVFASKFDENLKLRMFEAITCEEVKTLTKSKYLQSEVCARFPDIKERIKEGKAVLVCATPCQIAALRNYLGKAADADNLYLLDFFCHGVPSQELFDICKEYVEKRDGIRIIGYEFRSKVKNGCTPHYYTLKYIKSERKLTKTRLYLRDPFYLGFQKYITLRDSCYHCPYGLGNHAGDMTVGDFHNVDRYLQGINRFEGCSTVIINNNKGGIMWDAVQDSLVVHEISVERLYHDHEIYAGGTQEPPKRRDFLDDLELFPFDRVAHKWFNPNKEWKKIVYYNLPAFLRKRLKAMMRL